MSVEIATYQIVSGVAIGLSLVDIKLKFGEELGYLWTTWKPWHWSFDQFLYASCRCLPPLVWIFNIVVTLHLRPMGHQIPFTKCRQLIIYHTAVSYYLFAIIDLVLWRRVYFLYRYFLSIRIMLLAIIAIKLGQSIVFVFVSLPKVRFNAACVATNIHPVMVSFFVALGIVLHLFLLILTIMERTRHEKHLGPVVYGRVAPVFDILAKHGWIMVSFMIAYGSLVISASFRAQEMGPVTLSVFPVFVAGVSFLGCHLILTYRRVWESFRAQRIEALTTVEIMALTQIMELDSQFTRTIDSSASSKSSSSLASASAPTAPAFPTDTETPTTSHISPATAKLPSAVTVTSSTSPITHVSPTTSTLPSSPATSTSPGSLPTFVSLPDSPIPSTPTPTPIVRPDNTDPDGQK